MSPFLFVDSILPVLGDAAMKARTVFFSQLAVAPVSMIMLALSLKFMIALNGVLQADKSSSSTAQFMTILLMLVMLKITLKVTRDLSEKAGTSVSNMLGKVGGFATTGALAVATGGAGLAMGLQMDFQERQAREAVKQQEKAQKEATQKAVANQNALVNQNYGKRMNAMGIGETADAGNLGDLAASQGGIMTQPMNQQVNILG